MNSQKVEFIPALRLRVCSSFWSGAYWSGQRVLINFSVLHDHDEVLYGFDDFIGAVGRLYPLGLTDQVGELAHLINH
jgi:hypothetical protein